MKKYALCFGINDYPGSANDLSGCVNDANDWGEKLMSLGFSVSIVLNSNVTRQTFKSMIQAALNKMVIGDWLVITYSGHGTYTVDMSGDEPDGYDECLYLYDGLLLDDEIREIIKPASGKHIVFMLDSCFSGTATRNLIGKVSHRARFVQPIWITKKPKAEKVFKFLAEEDMIEILVSGCKDSEYSYDAYIGLRWNGAFTRYAIDALQPGLTFIEWYQALRKKLPSSKYPQTPQLEGSLDNKGLIVFETTEPEPQTEPVPDKWYKKWWIYAIAAGVIVILYFVIR